jgi:tripartite-type tricarboxylate transporter receptor subunit TctC
VASVAPQANIVVATPALPASTLKDAIELSRTRPLNYSSPGTGSVPQLLLAHLITTLPGVQIAHVPFPGAAQALTATMAGQTELSVATLPPAVPLVNSGKLKGLVVTTERRSGAVPDVPTAVEAGYPSLSSTVWTGFFVPVRTPKPVAEKIGGAVLKVAAMPDIKDRLFQLGFEPVSIEGAQFQRDIGAEIKRWSEIIEKAGLKQ